MLNIWANPPSMDEEYYFKYIASDRLPYDIFQNGDAVNVTEEICFESDVSKQKFDSVDIIPNYSGLPVISNKLIIAINEIISIEAQEIPVIINFSDGVSENYSILNILRSEPLIDKDKSNVSYYSKKLGGGVSDVDDYNTKDEDMPESAFIRESDFLSIVYIHPKVVAFLQTEKINYISLPLIGDYFD